MGVHGLWKLIDAAGKPVPVETLENKVLAVDVSIWLHQLVKGFQDAAGGVANAHLLGLFYRICKLLFFRIKPIFVFDGGVPALKKRTIAARQSGRSKATESAEKHRLELLQNLLKQHAVGLLLGKDVPLPRISSSATSKADRIYDLPPLPSTSKQSDEEEDEVKEDNIESSSDDEEYESKASCKYGDIHSIDVTSKDFKSLPADMRHDILSELKETRKQNSWGRLHLMPDESGDFSNFQMQRLLKRRSVQVGLEEAEKEMGPRGFTIAEIQEILEYQGVDISQRIASDESTRFIYSALKNLPQKSKPNKTDEFKEATVLSTTDKLNEDESDVDDPVFEAMVDQKDLTQEEILALIKDQADKKVKRKCKIEDLNDETNTNNGITGKVEKEEKCDKLKKVNSSTDEVIVNLKSETHEQDVAEEFGEKDLFKESHGNGEGSKNVNEPLNQITASEEDNGHQAWKPEPGKISLVKTKKHFDDRAVTKLLRESARNNLPPISKITLEPKNKRVQKRKKPVQKVLSGPNLSESSSSDESSEDKKVLPSKRPKNVSKKGFKSDLTGPSPCKPSMKINPTESEDATKRLNQELLDQDDELFKDIDIPEVSTSVSLNQGKGQSEIINKKVFLSAAIDHSSSSERNIATEKSKSVEIVLDLNKSSPDDDDLFRDIFEQNTVEQEVTESSSDNDFEEVKEEPSCKEVLTDFHKVQPERIIKSPVQSDSGSDGDLIVSSMRTRNLGPEPTFLEEDDFEINVETNIGDSKRTERGAILEELLLQASKLKEEIGNKSGVVSLEEDAKSCQQYKHFNLDDDDSPENIKISSPSKSSGELLDSKGQETDTDLADTNYFAGSQLALSPPKKSQSDLAKDLVTVDQVRQFQSTLEQESVGLIREQRREERVAATVSEQITQEAQELLRLFGIPWLVAPMEAEAQCAFLDIAGLTQGTITDDSDIWLFGANNVYKNFFDQKKFVKLFKSADIKRVFNIGRDELIMIGLLVGSDYTVGLSGIGPVTALEIVASYPAVSDDLTSPCDRLARFAAHFTGNKLSKRLAKKLLPVNLIEGFPSTEVVRAYTSPVVDESHEPFTWGKPDLEKIRNYAMEKFGWPADKTIKTLEPVFDKLKQDKTQTTLHGFFSWAFEDVQSKMSKRVENAVNLLANPVLSGDEDDPNEVLKRRKAYKKSASKRKSKHQNDPTAAVDPSLPGPSNRDSAPGPSTLSEDPEEGSDEPPSQAGPLQRHTLVRRVNQTIEMIKKGKMRPPGSLGKRKVKESFLLKPHPLDMEGPFEVGEMPSRKKVMRSDEEKVREIEEARAKAARVREKLKLQRIKEDEF